MTRPSPASPEALLQRFARRRGESEFRDLYRACSPRLYLLALRLVAGRETEAEELVQETWVRGVERLERFEGRSRVLTWLSGILVNVHREARRRALRAEREGREAGPTLVAATASEASTGGTRIDLERALASLPGGYREVTVLHELYGYTHREIADLLEIEVGTSKSQLARGRRRLRQALAAGDASGGKEDMA